MTSAPVASDPALSVSEVIDDAFGITGELAAGQQVEVTYEVTVSEESGRGDNLVMNALTPSSQEPPTECEEDDPNCTLTPVPLIEPAKTADPKSGSGVQAGEQVTYTLSFSNVGEAAGPVDHSDHLAEVLDDADLTGAPATSDPALVTSRGADGTIRVTGTLEPGQTATVSYTVTVRADGERGDNLLRNVVAPSHVADPDCEATGVICTEHPVGQIESWKTVDPAFGSTVRPGAEATYTLHFRNMGNAAAHVAHADLLSGVLDDADLTTEPLPSTDALTTSPIEDDRFTVTGSLDVGESATVTYTVTVRSNGERGDDRLENFLLPAGQEPPNGPCAPVDPDRATCTINPVSDVETPAPMPSTGTGVSAAALWSVLALLAGGGVLLLARGRQRIVRAG